MTVSAILFAISGISALFFPYEIAQWIDLPQRAGLLVQLFSAGLLAIAVTNYIGRNAIYGGIYGKPIMLGNFMFGIICGTSLLSAQLRYQYGFWVWLMILAFGLYTLVFIKLIFFPGKNQDKAP